MRYKSLSVNFFESRRKLLINNILDNSLVLIFSPDIYPKNGDQYYPFRQNSDLYHLCGIVQEDTILMLAPFGKKETDNEILFIKKIDEKQRIWNGEKYTKQQASDISGIKNVQWNTACDVFLNYLVNSVDNIYYLETPQSKSLLPSMSHNQRRLKIIKEQFPTKKFIRINEEMQSIRLVKEFEELAAIKKAVSITKDAYFRVLRKLKPNMMEYEVEAEITYEFIRQGANGHAYEPIVASGRNACILHYVDNHNKCIDGDLLLMDFGSEYAYYASDCSRTIPVNGKFSAKQSIYYQAVLDVFEKAKKLYVPGNTINIINAKVEDWMQEKMIELNIFTQEDVTNQDNDNPLFKKYYPHGTAHFIGLDVHDVGTKETVFEEGMVLSCEPGLYVENESIGIRIETDMVVAKEPVDLMADYPVTIEEIEFAMR